MKYAIVGGQGQLGQAFARRLGEAAVALGRADADLTRSQSLQAALDRVRPETVLNCAAYNLVDRAESEPEAAFAVNALGVHQLALLCRKRDCTLVHFSTDYVFGQD